MGELTNIAKTLGGMPTLALIAVVILAALSCFFFANTLGLVNSLQQC
jgi:hypothetical protein